MRASNTGRTPQTAPRVMKATPSKTAPHGRLDGAPAFPAALSVEGLVTVAKMEQVLAKTGTAPLHQILSAASTLFEWKDYPEGGVWDRMSGCRYVYHAHPGGAFPDEHGHFHFLVPSPLDAAPDGPAATTAAPPPHVALPSLSMTATGRPLGWFIAPPWHTGGALASGQTLVSALTQCRFDVAFPCYAANLWLGAMVHAHAPALLALSSALEAALTAERQARPGYEPLEDRERMILRAQKIAPAAQGPVPG